MPEPKRDKMPYSLTTLLTTIVKQAQADGRISADESNLINRIQIDARLLENEIVKARKEGNSSSIGEIFNRAKEEMIRNATAVAKEDEIISDDEENIINKLISELEAIDGE